MPVRFPVRLSRGTITATISPENVPVVLDLAVAMARENGDGIVVHTPCQSAEDKHALAQRLAEMFLRETAR